MDPTLNDRDLRLMGLPSKQYLLTHRFAKPTLVTPDGQSQTVALPTAATFAGHRLFGIRPGRLAAHRHRQGDRLVLDGARLRPRPAPTSISTAGHCGKAGDRRHGVDSRRQPRGRGDRV